MNMPFPDTPLPVTTVLDECLWTADDHARYIACSMREIRNLHPAGLPTIKRYDQKDLFTEKGAADAFARALLRGLRKMRMDSPCMCLEEEPTPPWPTPSPQTRHPGRVGNLGKDL